MTNTIKNVQGVEKEKRPKAKEKSSLRTLGPIPDLEKHLPADWWRTLFNSIYLKTDADVVENSENTCREVDLISQVTKIEPHDRILDLCCGQGRHCLELAHRGFLNVTGIDRSRYLLRLAKKRAFSSGHSINFSEGDARKIKLPQQSQDVVLLLGNSFGYFEKDEDDRVVLTQIKQVLRSKGTLVMDIVDGKWMAQHFEPRSWEWIDQNYLVCRERSLSACASRIITREVVVHAEKGIITDQFYAERLYTLEGIVSILETLGFENIHHHCNLLSLSSRNQDLGMMANRLFITANAPEKAMIKKSKDVLKVAVIMGDPRIPDSVKREGQFNQEDLETIQKFKTTIEGLKGYHFQFLDNHAALIKQLMSHPPSFVFNLCDEGYKNDAFKELHIPALLDMFGVPYTGAGPACLAICYNKALVRSLAASLEIPVPLETYVDPSNHSASIPSIFPALLKPNYGDSSIGITQEAVVHSAEELIYYSDKMKQLFPSRPFLVQEYLSGREFSVGVIGNPGNWEILPILEVDYSRLPKHLPKILSYESKWLPDSPYWTEIRYKLADLNDEVSRQLIDYSTELFERLECHDYARFDFREDAQGELKLLEVNPNPGWCWDGKLNLMAGFRGLSYQDLLEMILSAAKERLGIKLS
jgi:D-alanine-D-alanine ligase